MARYGVGAGWGTAYPLPGAQIDWGHPLAAGLSLHSTFGGGLRGIDDQVTGSLFSPTGTTPIIRVGPTGPGLSATSFATDGGGIFSSQYPSRWPKLGDASIMWRGWLTGNGATASIFAAIRNTPGTSTVLGLRRSGNDEIDVRARSTGTLVTVTSSGANLSAKWGVPLTFVAVRRLGFYTIGYIGSKEFGRDTTNISISNSTPDSVHVGNTADASSVIGGFTSQVAIWNRALTANDVAWLNVEPYCFLSPPGVGSGA